MTKASPGRRSRRLERRGRPAGSYKSLFKDAQRFSIAAWLASEPRCGPHVAARMAIVLIEERTPITIQDVEGLLLVIGADYKATASAKARTSSDLDGRASQLADKARLMIARATPRELAWLTRSSGALRALSTFFRGRESHGSRPGNRIAVAGRLARNPGPYRRPARSRLARELPALRRRSRSQGALVVGGHARVKNEPAKNLNG